MEHCGLEPYHVPQQSRRDKLRLISQTNLLHHPLPHTLPLPLPLTTTTTTHQSSSPNIFTDQPDFVKQETPISNFMGFVYNSHNFILDPQNPDITANQNPFLSVPPQHNLRVFDQIQPPDHHHHQGMYRTDMVSTGQGLSLSLSSKQTNINNSNFQRIFTANEDNLLLLSRSSVPLGPFTGYASILKGSRFLRPAQLLLDELCHVGNGIYAQKFDDVDVDDVGLTDPSSDDGIMDDTEEGSNRHRRKSTLVSMLHEVYRMYKFYYHQMHAVVASFETVSGLGNAAPYANLALKAMSKDFRSLKDAITDQLQSVYNNSNQNDDDHMSSSLGNNSNPSLYRKPVHNGGGGGATTTTGFMDHQPVWRPQRGLPERAVTVLRAWLFEHFLHPYPTDTDKIMLAKKTGLSRSQVSNWFINARVRLWKPMVEEIHMLETRQQSQKPDCQKDQQHLPIAISSLTCENRLNSIQKNHQELSSKRGRDDFDSSSTGHHQEQHQQQQPPIGVPYDNLSRLGFLGNSNIGGGGSVSLTLGLHHHQNNGMALVPDQTYPAVRRLGLDVNMNNNNNNNEGYMFGGFEAHENRPFIREIMGGQLLHDFVG